MSEPFTTQTIDRPDGVTLATWTRDADDGDAPTIVLVHGFPDTHIMWTDLIEVLPTRYRLVTYDVRGAGASTAPTRQEGYALGRLTDDLAAVIAATAPSGRAHVVGHDWGGITGFEAVADPRTAASIASFTAICAPSLDRTAEWARGRLRPSPGWVGDVLAVGGQLLRSWYIGAFQLPLAPRVMASLTSGVLDRLDSSTAARPTAPTAAQDAANGVGLYRANIGRLRSPDRRHVTVPLLLVLGEHDRFVSPHLHDDLHQWAPASQRLTLAGGHWLPITHVSTVADLVIALVDDVEAGHHSRPAA